MAKELGLPLIVKPSREGSTIGLTKVTRVEDIEAAYRKAREYDDMVLAEEFIAGAEVTASILGEQALPLIRIEAPGGSYDYQAKYFSDETRYYLSVRIASCAGKPHSGARPQGVRASSTAEGWGRVDVMLDAKDEPYLLEANTVPGMTGHSLVPMAAKVAGILFDDLVVRILEDAHVG